jgi:hypothetical protein
MAATTKKAARQPAVTAKKGPASPTKRAANRAAATTERAANSAATTTSRVANRAAATTERVATSAATATERAAKRAAKATTSAASTTQRATKRAAHATTSATRAATRATSDAATTTARTASETNDDTAAAVHEAIMANRPTVSSLAGKASAATGSLLDAAAARAAAVIDSFPSIDFSNFDVDSLRQLDPRKIEWDKIDRPDLDPRKIVDTARDAAYVMVGFGVLAVQRGQVRRRELTTAISDRLGADRHQVEEAISAFETRLTKFDDAVEARVDHALDMIGERLPDQAETLLKQVNSVAKTARRQVRGMLLSNAA